MKYQKQSQTIAVIVPKTKEVLMTTIKNWKPPLNGDPFDNKTEANYQSNIRSAKSRLLREFKSNPKSFQMLTNLDPATVRKTVDAAMLAEFPGPSSGYAQAMSKTVDTPGSEGIETRVEINDPPVLETTDSDFKGKAQNYRNHTAQNYKNHTSDSMTFPVVYIWRSK